MFEACGGRYGQSPVAFLLAVLARADARRARRGARRRRPRVPDQAHLCRTAGICRAAASRPARRCSQAMARELAEEGNIELTGPPVLHGVFFHPLYSQRDHVTVYRGARLPPDRAARAEPRDRRARLLPARRAAAGNHRRHARPHRRGVGRQACSRSAGDGSRVARCPALGCRQKTKRSGGLRHDAGISERCSRCCCRCRSAQRRHDQDRGAVRGRRADRHDGAHGRLRTCRRGSSPTW